VVVGVLGWHTPAHAGLADASGHTEEAESTPCATHPVYDSYPYVLVMERAERSLHDACCKERLAGYDMAGVHIVLLAVLCCLAALHARRVIHSDLKQRNVIRRGAQGLDPLRRKRSSVACLSLHVSNGAHAAIARTDGRLCAHWCPRWRQDLHGLLPARARARPLRCAPGVSAARLHVLRRLELWGDGVCNRSVCVSREHA